MQNKSKYTVSKPATRGVLARFFSKPARYRRRLMEAVFWIAVMQFVIRFLSFRVLKRLIGSSGDRVHDRQDRSHLESGSIKEMETTMEASDSEIETVQDIVRAVRSVSRRTPWKSKCLVQSSAAKIMMNKAGIPSELCLGVLKPGSAQSSESGNKELRPHAWLISENRVVLGGENLEQYVMVSRFR